MNVHVVCSVGKTYLSGRESGFSLNMVSARSPSPRLNRFVLVFSVQSASSKWFPAFPGWDVRDNTQHARSIIVKLAV